MQPIWLLAMISLDGKFDGPGEGAERIDWFRADSEWLDYSVELLSSVGALMFGRRTYEGMEAFWPHQTGPVADLMNGLPKLVASTTLDHASWDASTIVRDPINDVAAHCESLHAPVLVMGSGTLATTLSANGLLSEYRLAINPTILGDGAALFDDGHPRLELDHSSIRTFASGITELRLTPQRQPADA